MRYCLLLLPFVLAACSSAKPDAPRPPEIGMANPAAIYCQQRGGERVPVQSPQGVRTECKLPGGEVIDEWELWRRDHPRSGS
ncbi:putative hemolysin [Vagococcus sp. WN89Y]|uniref:putative hemolysin n=1 Tax=Vagococcus sp. WN89Y TaxID=3457258 RepID=UPI003FCD06B6